MIFVKYPVQYLNPQNVIWCFMVLMPMNNFGSSQGPLCVTSHLLVTVTISVVKYVRYSTERLKNLPAVPCQKMAQIECDPRDVAPKLTLPLFLP